MAIILAKPIVEVGLLAERKIKPNRIPGLPAVPLPLPAVVPEVSFLYSFKHMQLFKRSVREY